MSWEDVDPARHPFDKASAAAVVASLEPSRHVPLLPEGAGSWPYGGDDLIRRFNEWEYRSGDPWVAAMSYALAERFGSWTFGWRWARGEGDIDGGPIRSWFSARSSISTPEATPAIIATALCEWREWLEDLAGWFDVYPIKPSAVAESQVAWRSAVRDLITHVTSRTGCMSAWYGHCHTVLVWFLQRWGVDDAVANAMVQDAVGGRFESWTEPDPGLVDDVVDRLSLPLPVPLKSEPAEVRERRDDLQVWLGVRDRVPWRPARADGGASVDQVSAVDGAVSYIIAFDNAIDPARARGLLAALELVRTDAAQQMPLSFDLLQRWQARVLGTPMPRFRVDPAYAKRGKERYGIGPEIPGRFDVCLAQSTFDPDEPLTVSVRAARAFLDVCFFHPFDDGNARSAFLAAMFVLAREGVSQESVQMLRQVSVGAGDVEDAAWLARSIESRSLVGNGQDNRE